MSDQYPFFAYLSRMRYINRWGLMRNTKNENLSEHSLETAFIAPVSYTHLTLPTNSRV